MMSMVENALNYGNYSGYATGDQSTPQERKVRSDWQGCLANTAPETIGKGLVQLATGEVGIIPQQYDAFCINNLFSEEECGRLLAASEEIGYGTTNYPKAYRGNLRLITTDFGLTQRVWERLSASVPQSVLDSRGEEWEAIGLNECWRLAKYFPGDRFQAHVDANFTRGPTERSMYTVNIYMNGGFNAGTTRFYSSGSREALDWFCTPQAGMAVLFRQPPDALYLHDGEQLGSGIKYLFRTDVMYRKKQRSSEADDSMDDAKSGRRSGADEAKSNAGSAHDTKSSGQDGVAETKSDAGCAHDAKSSGQDGADEGKSDAGRAAGGKADGVSPKNQKKQRVDGEADTPECFADSADEAQNDPEHSDILT